jgi:putative membrane protein
MNLTKLTFALITALSVPSAALAQAPAAKTKPVKEPLNQADLAVLQHHHHGNLMEIEMGKLAQSKGSAALKKYAATLVADHQKADKAALALAKARDAKLENHPAPTNEAETAEHKQMTELMTKLKGLSGAEFEREYLTAMVEAHTKEVGYLTTAIAGVTDPKLKMHLEGVKPVIEKHAKQASDLLAKAAPPPATTGTPPASAAPVKPAS